MAREVCINRHGVCVCGGNSVTHVVFPGEDPVEVFFCVCHSRKVVNLCGNT